MTPWYVSFPSPPLPCVTAGVCAMVRDSAAAAAPPLSAPPPPPLGSSITAAGGAARRVWPFATESVWTWSCPSAAISSLAVSK